MRPRNHGEVAVEEVNDKAVAVINDDSTEVGCVHFGCRAYYAGPNENIVGHRSGILGPEFIPVADAVKNASGYESWSRLCLENLEVLLSKAGYAMVRR